MPKVFKNNDQPIAEVGAPKRYNSSLNASMSILTLLVSQNMRKYESFCHEFLLLEFLFPRVVQGFVKK